MQTIENRGSRKPKLDFYTIYNIYKSRVKLMKQNRKDTEK